MDGKKIVNIPNTTKNPATALVDHCVKQLIITSETAVQYQTINLGRKRQIFPIVGFRRKQKLKSGEFWKQEQIESLPTIARLAEEKVIKLFSYNELNFESLPGMRGLRGALGDLFKKIEICKVPSAIERSRFMQMNILDYSKKERLIEFCNILINLNDPDLLLKAPIRLTDFEKKNLKALNRFREICSGLNPGMYPDAFHLWTAETNNLDYFLTTDRKFINALTKSKKLPLLTKPICPRVLLNEMGVFDLDPMPIQDDGFHNFFEET